MTAPLNNYTRLPFAQIHREDDENVRTRYNPEALEELKASILSARMLLQNMGVIEMPDGSIHLYYGFRRHRVIEELLADPELAEDIRGELEAPPCLIVKADTPEAVTRIKLAQLIENLQREEVDPVDEAQGYEKALKAVDQNGALIYPTHEALSLAIGKVNKGAAYVGRRLKLLNAPDFLLDAIRDKVVTSVRIGEICGCIPNKKSREEAARRAIKHPHLGVPMSTREFEEMVRGEFMSVIDRKSLDVERCDLLDGNQRGMMGFTGQPGEVNDGSCERCAFRTGNDPLLEGELAERGGVKTDDGSKGGLVRGVDRWLCQHPMCLGWKNDALHKILIAQAEANGMRMMEKAKSKLLFVDGVFDGTLAATYARHDHKPGFDCTGHYGAESLPTWGEILEGEDVSWIIAQQPGKKGFIYLLEKPEAIRVAEAKWARLAQPNLFANRPGAKVTSKSAPAKSAAKDDDNGGDAPVDETLVPIEDEVARGGEGAPRPRQPAAEQKMDLLPLSDQEAEAKAAAALVRLEELKVSVAYMNEALGALVKGPCLKTLEVMALDRLPFLHETGAQRLLLLYGWMPEDRVMTLSRDAMLRTLATEIQSACKVVNGDSLDLQSALMVNLLVMIEVARCLDTEGAPLIEALADDVERISAEPDNVVPFDGFQRGPVDDVAEPDVPPLIDPVQSPQPSFDALEKAAHDVYMKTGSILKAALEAGVSKDTVRAWHRRRGWKAEREALGAGDGKEAAAS